MKITTGKILSVCLVGCILSGAAYAQFGVGEIAVVKQLITEYKLLSTMNGTIRDTYANIQTAAHNATHKDAWIPGGTPVATLSAANSYGNTSAWINAANTGSGAAGGYGALAVPLNVTPYPVTVDPSITAIQNRNLGMVQLMDGTAINALSQAGLARSTAIRNDTVINKLSADSASDSPAMNTQAALLNQISAGQVISARQQESNGQLLQADVQMRAVELAEVRNQKAAAMLDEMSARSAYSKISRDHIAGTSAALAGARPW